MADPIINYSNAGEDSKITIPTILFSRFHIKLKNNSISI